MEQEFFGRTSDGTQVSRYTITNGILTLKVLDYGCAVQSLTVPDREGRPVDVVLGYGDADGYEHGGAFHGVVVGRCANRIRDSRLVIDGVTCPLPPNEGKNHLHGAFPHTHFRAAPLPDGIALTTRSPAGEDGFPGNVEVTVRYRLEGHSLHMEYEGVTDAPTALNLTNHCYFDLSGGAGIAGHTLQLRAGRFCELAPGQCPTGALPSVENTPLDFRASALLGDRLHGDHPQLALAGGLDHFLVLDEGSGPAARLSCPATGIALSLTTDAPGLQLYAGNFLADDPRPGKGGVPYSNYAGVALETSRLPGGSDLPWFDRILLRPGQVYAQRTTLTFTAEDDL